MIVGKLISSQLNNLWLSPMERQEEETWSSSQGRATRMLSVVNVYLSQFTPLEKPMGIQVWFYQSKLIQSAGLRIGVCGLFNILHVPPGSLFPERCFEFSILIFLFVTNLQELARKYVKADETKKHSTANLSTKASQIREKQKAIEGHRRKSTTSWDGKHCSQTTHILLALA